jgi:hypothetical protein
MSEAEVVNSVKSSVPSLQLAFLRAIVAALGERATPPWWRTQFLTEVGLRTVGRIVPRTAVLGAVASTSIAAKAEHDRWVGVGRRFHLFRLPGSIELAVGTALRAAEVQSRIRDALAGRERLLDELASLAGSRLKSQEEGPIVLGDARQLGKPASITGLAACYFAAFNAGGRSFPYFEETA